MSESLDHAQLEAEITALLSRMRSLHLASVHADGMPLASYAPFAITADQNGVWVILSELAAHARNLREHPDCSVFLPLPKLSIPDFKSLKELEDCGVDDFILVDYKHHAALSAPMAI